MERRRPLVEVLRLQRSIVSPVRCVPPEILSEIIAHAIGVYDSDISRATDSTDVKSGPIWVFGRVCHGWREVIRSSPKLWSHITLFSDHTCVTALETILERSLNLPLTISVLMKHPVRQQQSKAINLLVEHFNRWYNVILRLPFYPKMVQMFSNNKKMAGKRRGTVETDNTSPASVPTTILHSLILHHRANGSSEFPLDLISHFSTRAGFRNIRRLVLRSDMNPVEIHDIDAYIPWKQLELFDNVMPTYWPDDQPSEPRNTLSMLRQMPNLTTLNVHDSRYSTLDQTQLTSSVVTLQNVHTATFRSSGVLPALRLPALQHTVLGLKDLERKRGSSKGLKPPYLILSSVDKASISEFSNLLIRSSPPLKSITFQSITDVEDTFHLLRCLPSSVETLAYIHYKHRDTLLNLLDLSQSSYTTTPMLLPNLKEFTICASGDLAPDPDLLLSCVKSRLTYDSDNAVSPSGLRRLKVMYDDEAKVPVGDYERILALRDQGLLISICAVKSYSVYPDLLLSDERYPW
jgi:hypothetical protein